MKLNEILNFEKFEDAIKEIVRREIEWNFKEGGRYGDGKFGGGNKKWKPSRRALRENGQTLIDTGNLLSSIHGRIVNDNIEMYVQNVPYAPVHQYGKGEVPARPYLTLPDSFEDEVRMNVLAWLDLNKIKNILLK